MARRGGALRGSLLGRRLTQALLVLALALGRDGGAADAHELPRRTDGSQPTTNADLQIKLKPKCFQCLQSFCRDRVQALPATSRYCCKPKVQESINNEISCARFQHLGSSAVDICNTHKSDWNICVNLVMDDLCQGCAQWADDYDLETLFTPIEHHGNIIRPRPADRDKSTAVIPVVRAHQCAQDPLCDRHGKERAMHVGNYSMPAYILKQWKLIAHSVDFDPAYFAASCGAENTAPNNTCTVQLSQLDMRNAQCEAWQNCSQTYTSMLDLADHFNQLPEFDPPLEFVWA